MRYDGSRPYEVFSQTLSRLATTKVKLRKKKQPAVFAKKFTKDH